MKPNKQRSDQEWAMHIAECERLELTDRDYERLTGVSSRALSAARLRLQRKLGVINGPRPRVKPIHKQLTAAHYDPHKKQIDIHLPDGIDVSIRLPMGQQA